MADPDGWDARLVQLRKTEGGFKKEEAYPVMLSD